MPAAPALMHFRGVLFIHTADRDHRYPHRAASLCERCDSLRRSERALRRRVVDRSEENVARASPFRFERFLDTVAGNADQKSRRRVPARHHRTTSRQLRRIRAQMHARRAGCDRHVKPVVHDNARAPGSSSPCVRRRASE